MAPKRSSTLRSFIALLPVNRSASWEPQQSSSSLSDEPQEISNTSPESTKAGHLHSPYTPAGTIQRDHPNGRQTSEGVNHVQPDTTAPLKACAVGAEDDPKRRFFESPLRDGDLYVNQKKTSAETFNSDQSIPNMMPPTVGGEDCNCPETNMDAQRWLSNDSNLPDSTKAWATRSGPGIRPHPESSKSTLYPPLGSGMDTRLITLEREKISHRILCKSKPVALHDDLEYVALSYHWGAGEPDQKILLNGEVIMIRKTLSDALAAFIFHGIRQVWVDSLSVDQFDQNEKGQQVSKMHIIYSHASRVYAWLGPRFSSKDGPDGPDGELGLKFVNDLPTVKEDSEEQRSIINRSVTAEKQMAVIDLINRPYWKRTWIIQELSMARRARVLCGKEITDFKKFLDNLFSLNSSIVSTLIPRNIKEHLECLRDFHEQEQSVTREPRMSLISALVTSRHADVTFPRDKIYSMLHLAHDSARLVDTPNYVQSEETVYVRFAENVIHKQGHAAILLLARGSRSLPMLTSEVAHIDATETTSPFPFQKELSKRPSSIKSTGSRIPKITIPFGNDSNTSIPLTTATHDTSPKGAGRNCLELTVSLPTWCPDWRLLDDPLPSWIIDAVLDDKPVTRLSHLECKQYELHVRGADISVINAVSGLRYASGETDAMRYRADWTNEPNVNALAGFANDTAFRLWNAVVQFNDPDKPLAEMNHPCNNSQCPASDIVGYSLARILTKKHSSSQDEHSDEGVIDKWMASNSDLRLGPMTVSDLMKEICAQPFFKDTRRRPKSTRRASQPQPQCEGEFPDHIRKFAKGLRKLEDNKMRLAFTSHGAIEAVYREASVGDSIFRLERCSLPVVLRKTTPKSFDSYYFVGEMYLRNHLKPTAAYDRGSNWIIPNNNFRTITIR